MEQLVNFLRAAEELMLQLLRQRASSQEIERQLRRLARRMGIDPRTLAGATLQEAIARARVRMMTIPSQLYTAAVREITRTAAAIDRGVIEMVTRALRRGTSEQRLRERLRREFDVQRQHVYTIGNTIEASVGRAALIEQSHRDRVQRFRYVGPRARARAFCSQLLDQAAAGKTWTIEEIERLDNGQGLPVLYFCGGYNCRHRWMPVQ